LKNIALNCSSNHDSLLAIMRKYLLPGNEIPSLAGLTNVQFRPVLSTSFLLGSMKQNNRILARKRGLQPITHVIGYYSNTLLTMENPRICTL